MADILQAHGPLRGAVILDLGCGEGGTALALAARGAVVTAVDANPACVAKLRRRSASVDGQLTVQTGDAHALSFLDARFDWVVLQDVIEHLPRPAEAVPEIARVLKPGGHLYLVSPNRWSPLNWLMDPHWNLPAVAILPRRAVRFAVTRVWRRTSADRTDLAALLSLPRLRRLFAGENIVLRFVNRHVAQTLFRHPTAVVNSPLHLRVMAWLKKSNLEGLVHRLVNDRFGFFNYVVNPTWYLIGEKRPIRRDAR